MRRGFGVADVVSGGLLIGAWPGAGVPERDSGALGPFDTSIAGAGLGLSTSSVALGSLEVSPLVVVASELDFSGSVRVCFGGEREDHSHAR
jgi:hypothetical protein